MTTTPATLPLFKSFIIALEDEGVFAIEQAMAEISRTYGQVSGNLRVDCVRDGPIFEITVWRA